MDQKRAVDPVCGMTVDTDKAFAALEYEGCTYHFCAGCCQHQFQANPAKYVRRARRVLSGESEDDGHD